MTTVLLFRLRTTVLTWWYCVFMKATPHSNLRRVIAEYIRVLCILGFLEISGVDIDLLNVGPYMRRAIRSLKV